MRVRLIRPILVEIVQIDTAATRAKGGYDDEFGAVKATIRAGKRVEERQNRAPVLLPGQWEDQTQNAQRLFGAGNSPEAKVAVTFEYRDLLRKGLVDPRTGRPTLQVNDLLTATYSLDGTRLVQRLAKPGLYAVEVRPASIGLDGGIGIVVVRFNDRALGQAPG